MHEIYRKTFTGSCEIKNVVTWDECFLAISALATQTRCIAFAHRRSSWWSTCCWSGRGWIARDCEHLMYGYLTIHCTNTGMRKCETMRKKFQGYNSAYQISSLKKCLQKHRWNTYMHTDLIIYVGMPEVFSPYVWISNPYTNNLLKNHKSNLVVSAWLSDEWPQATDTRRPV